MQKFIIWLFPKGTKIFIFNFLIYSFLNFLLFRDFHISVLFYSSSTLPEQLPLKFMDVSSILLLLLLLLYSYMYVCIWPTESTYKHVLRVDYDIPPQEVSPWRNWFSLSEQPFTDSSSSRVGPSKIYVTLAHPLVLLFYRCFILL